MHYIHYQGMVADDQARSLTCYIHPRTTIGRRRQQEISSLFWFPPGFCNAVGLA